AMQCVQELVNWLPTCGRPAGIGPLSLIAGVAVVMGLFASGCRDARQDASEATPVAAPSVSAGPGESPTTTGTSVATTTSRADVEYRSVALGLLFRYPTALDEPANMNCHPIETDGAISLSNNVAILVEPGTNEGIDAAVE